MFARVMRGKLALLTIVGIVLLTVAVPHLHAQEAARRIAVFFEVGEDTAPIPRERAFSTSLCS